VTRVGLISDTHGLLRPEAVAFLEGCDRIVHAGDVGDEGILVALEKIAPLTAVRGNIDRDDWAQALPHDAWVLVEGLYVYVVHDLADLTLSPHAAGIRVVVSGHSHVPLVRERDGVWFVNPGSSGPRRFSLPVSIGELIVDGGGVTPRTVELELG
jgi:putative phosphoesterase